SNTRRHFSGYPLQAERHCPHARSGKTRFHPAQAAPRDGGGEKHRRTRFRPRMVLTRSPMSTSTDALVAVIDDDTSVRTALGRLLRSAGLSVQLFACAEDFLEKGTAAACLILDQCLPGLSGLELYRRLLDEGRQVAVVFITGHENEPTRREALAAGAVAFL